MRGPRILGKEEAESKGLREGRSKEEEERPRVSQGDEGRVYARNEAEPKRRGGPRALGFQSDLYNLKEEKNKSSNAKYSQNYSILVNEE